MWHMESLAGVLLCGCFSKARNLCRGEELGPIPERAGTRVLHRPGRLLVGLTIVALGSGCLGAWPDKVPERTGK